MPDFLSFLYPTLREEKKKSDEESFNFLTAVDFLCSSMHVYKNVTLFVNKM